MKRQTVGLCALLLAASTFFSACHDSTNRNAGSLEFDSLHANKTAHLFADTAKPACNITLLLTYVSSASDSRLKDSLNTYFLASCFGESSAALSPEEAVSAYADNYIKEYRSDLEPMYKKDEQESDSKETLGAWYSYYKGIAGRIQFYEKHLLVYRIDYNEYTGGAHGIYMTTFLNMDLHTLTPIRLDDLFVEEYREALTDLLWNQLMADHQVSTRQELEEMGYATTGELEPTDNFYLGKEGITFYYNVYEIAPYVMGPTAITLPYEMMTHLLTGDNVPLNEIRRS